MATQQMLIVCDDRYVLVAVSRGLGPTARQGRRLRQPANLLITPLNALSGGGIR
jgi:hypothetical protein